MKNKKSTFTILPVFLAFFIMGFCDIIGKASDYIKADFHLSDGVTGFLPSMVFIWFLVFSIPTGGLMNKWGRKNTVIISMGVTIVGLLLPLLVYNLYTCLIAFALIGIGNTILQVSLNPLLANVVANEKLTSSLTVGQVVKAISSLFGPFILSMVFMQFSGHWYFALPILGIVTLISSVWLLSVKIEREQAASKVISFSAAFSLLKSPVIFLCFLGILFVVGVDVGINYVGSKLLIGRCGEPTTTSAAQTAYFACRTFGALLGAILLTRVNEGRYFKINMLLAIVALFVLFFVGGDAVYSKTLIVILVGVIGFACASIFPIIFSKAIKAEPDKANEISGLMITGVSGGALIPALMGGLTSVTDGVGMYAQTGSLIVVLGCMLYLLGLSFVKVKEKFQ